jgi:hypothetical protein
MRGATEAPVTPTGKPRLVVALGGALGSLMLLIAAGWVGFSKAGLATVLTTRLDVVSETTAPRGSWAPVVLCTVAGLVLTTNRLVESSRVDIMQIGAATWTLVWLSICTSLGTGWEFTSSDSHCVYRSCWPYHYQETAIAAPLLITCVSMYVMAILGRHNRWWIRALVPSLTFIALCLLQVAFWNRFIVPFFNSPPPF